MANCNYFEHIVLCHGIDLPEKFFDRSLYYVMDDLKKFLEGESLSCMSQPARDWEVVVECVRDYEFESDEGHVQEITRVFYRFSPDHNRIRLEHGTLTFQSEGEVT